MDGAHMNQMTRQKWSMQTIDVSNDDLSNDDNAAKNESDDKTDEDDLSEEDSANINDSVFKSKKKRAMTMTLIKHFSSFPSSLSN